MQEWIPIDGWEKRKKIRCLGKGVQPLRLPKRLEQSFLVQVSRGVSLLRIVCASSCLFSRCVCPPFGRGCWWPLDPQPS